MVGIGACVSIQFGVNEACKRILKKYKKEYNKPNPNNLSLFQLAGCGAIAGLTNAVISIPVEHIRIKMQVEGTKLIKITMDLMIVLRKSIRSMESMGFIRA